MDPEQEDAMTPLDELIEEHKAISRMLSVL